MGIVSGFFKAVVITVAVVTIGPLVLHVLSDIDDCCDNDF